MQERRYLKSELAFIGVNTPTLRRETRRWLRQHPELTGAALARCVRELWRQDVHELRHFAIEILLARERQLRRADATLLESLLRRSATWAYVDVLATRLLGPLVVRHPDLTARLDRWSVDPDFWMRRAAMLTLLAPLRQGGGDWDRFVGYADGMLEEREFFIRKAIGWILREVGKRRPRLVVSFLEPRLARVAGLTLREGIKYLPERDRRRLLRGAERARGSRTTPSTGDTAGGARHPVAPPAPLNHSRR